MGFDNWLANIQDWLLPRLCPSCGIHAGAGHWLCPACTDSLPRIAHACPSCATPYDHPADHVCGACQQQPPAFDRAFALYRYAPPVDHLIRALKFHEHIELAHRFGEELARRVVPSARPDLIVPVPLHPNRLRRRGFNQALEIARPVARALAVPLARHALRRVRASAAQSELPVAARRKNVRGAFAVRDGAALAGLSVALVDDVMTTGSTAESAARALRAAGARDIAVWVVARA